MKATVAKRLGRVSRRMTLKLTHYGRKSGKRFEVTIWFIAAGDKIYLSTGNADRQWVRNVKKTPRVQLAIGDDVFTGDARFLTDPHEVGQVRSLVMRKYWVFLPLIALWRVLAAVGIVPYEFGAFEVTLSEAVPER